MSHHPISTSRSHAYGASPHARGRASWRWLAVCAVIGLVAACGDAGSGEGTGADEEPTADEATEQATAEETATAAGEPTGTETDAEADETESEAAQFYRDNPVTVVVNSRAGGLSDTVARMVEPHWEEITGGDMQIENEEGGGGLVAINQVFAAEGDPATMGVASLGPHVITYDLFDTEGVDFVAEEFNHLSFFPPSVGAAMIALGANSEYETLEDLQQAAEAVPFGTPHPESGSSQTASFAADVMGYEIVLRPGYRGSDIAVAAAGGEFDGYSWTGTGVVQHVDEGLIREPLFAVHTDRSPIFPDTPALTELVELTPEQEEMLDLIIALNVRTGTFAPPGVDQVYVDYLSDTIFEAMTSEAFVEQAVNTWTKWDDPLNGEESQALLEEAMATDSAIVEALATLTAGNVQ